MCDNTIKPSKSGKLLDAETWDALRKAGVPEAELEADQPFGPVIFSYTRADAIADGLLVDLTADGETKLLCCEAGFQLPVAVTETAFGDTVLAGTTDTPDGEFVFPAGQSCKGRLWDVLMVFKAAIRTQPAGEDRVRFTVSVFDGQKAVPVQLWALCGPGDDLEPVITIMLEGED